MTAAKTLDFTNVKEGGGQFNKKRQPAGDYRGRVTKVVDAPTKDGKEQWTYTIVVGSGTYPYRCQFEANVLWKLRNLMVAAGINVPKKRVKVKAELPVGKYVGVTLEDDEYDGKAQSDIAAVFPTSELSDEAVDVDDDAEDVDDEEEDEDIAPPVDDDEEEEDGEEEEPTPPPAKKKKAKPAPPPADDDDEDELEELDIEDM
jgi:hypothetical protein